MPHVPRGYAPTFGDPPGKDKPDKPAAEAADQPARRRFGVPRISVRSWSPDLDAIIETMLGKEVATDVHTGQLVPTRPA